ncbi:hypothetical protein [Flagellimonas sp. 2504JD1-5]
MTKTSIFKIIRVAGFILLSATLFLNGCSVDHGQGWADSRYTTNFKFYFDNPNPKTGTAYTAEELAALDYDPSVEGKFEEGDPVVLSFVLPKQISELKVVDTSNENVLYTFNEATVDGDKFRIGISTTLTDLGLLAVKDRKGLKFDFTYQDGAVGSVIYKITYAKFEVIDPNADLSLDLIGYWRFNDANNLLGASRGNDLALGGAASHSASSGVDGNDGAAHLDIGTWYDVDHGMPASGGDRVNEYTMIWDVKVATADLGKYICLLQFNTANDTDGAVYIHPNAGFWFNGGPGGHAEGTIKGDTWHRIAMTVNAPEVVFYVDGVEIYKDEVLATPDGTFSLDPSKFIILGENSSNDGNGEDNPISITEFMLFKKAFSKSVIEGLPPVSEPAINDISQQVVGRWNFDDDADLLKAQLGNTLALGGAAAHSFAPGVDGDDGAALLDIGTWYDVDHGLPASGGDRVNEFTMIWDVKVATADLGKYICLFQHNTANDTDGAVYIHPNAGFWFNGGPGGHAEGTIQGDTWHRIVLTVSSPEVVFYVDGVEIYKDEALASTDGNFSLDPSKFIILGENSSNDGNGEDNPITISDFILLKSALSKSRVESLPAVDQPAF